MITDLLINIALYKGINDKLDQAIDWLQSHDVSELENGRHDIQGEDIFVNVMDALLRDSAGAEYEYHNKYADLQIDITGSELWQWSSDAPDYRNYDSVKDCGFMFSEDKCSGHLGEGRFVLFFPGELHKPSCKSGKGDQIRKAVLKIEM